MADFVSGPVEAKFADLIWANEPLGSGELAKLIAAEARGEGRDERLGPERRGDILL